MSRRGPGTRLSARFERTDSDRYVLVASTAQICGHKQVQRRRPAGKSREQLRHCHML